MSDEDESFEDGEYYSTDILKDISSNLLSDVIGSDLRFLGYISNITESLIVAESAKPSAYMIGTKVFLEDYILFGIIIDIFGPVSKPFYILKAVNENMAPDEFVGLQLYVSDACSTEEIIADDDPNEGSSDGCVSE